MKPTSKTTQYNSVIGRYSLIASMLINKNFSQFLTMHDSPLCLELFGARMRACVKRVDPRSTKYAPPVLGRLVHSEIEEKVLNINRNWFKHKLLCSDTGG